MVFLAVLGAVAVGFVLKPIFGRQTEPRAPIDEAARKREQLTEKKQRLLAAIKDLDFEHRAGKLSDADHYRTRAEDLSQIAQVMAQIEALETPAEPAKPIEPGPVSTDVTCPSCQQANPSHAQFCFRCGKPIAISLQCPRCGTPLPDQARFCTACGTDIASK